MDVKEIRRKTMSELNKAIWAQIPTEERSKVMSERAKIRWASIPKKERKKIMRVTRRKGYYKMPE